MPASIPPPRPGQPAARRALHYAFYDWSQKIPGAKRVLVWLGIVLQGYAIYAAITRSLIWPLILVDRQLNEDDITIVLVKRSPVQLTG